jgi:hypothetical protein
VLKVLEWCRGEILEEIIGNFFSKFDENYKTIDLRSAGNSNQAKQTPKHIKTIMKKKIKLMRAKGDYELEINLK